MILLLQFLLAHILGDFFLQGNAWVADKEQKKWGSVYLYIHSIIHGMLVIAVTTGFTYWKQALIISFTHFIIDGLKLQFQKEGTKRTWFFTDQFLHIAVIIITWWYSTHKTVSFSFFHDTKMLGVTVAVLLLLYPSSFFIKYFIARWVPIPPNANQSTGIPTINNKESESLEKAGRIIGMIERIMIFIFIMVDQWEAIGFLLAAKSIFRFGELNTAKDRRLTEYVLIGTLVSFFVAILIGLATSRLIH